MSLDASFDIKNVVCLYFYDLKDTINLYNLNKDHQHNIIITNLYDIELKNKLNQQIIEQNKYKYVERLNAFDNEKIYNVNHMKETLKILNCGYNCGIDQNGISKLNLIELCVIDNKKIKNVNHMKKTLNILYCGWNSGIDQNGISQLNLIELYARSNKKIKNVNHMKNTLEILCCKNSGVDQNGVCKLNLNLIGADAIW